jgi:predicted nucleic acid-binding protein
LPRVRFLHETDGIDEFLGDWVAKLDLRTGGWTDAYLAAFAVVSNCRLVAFDGGFSRFKGLEFLHLGNRP